MGEILQEIRQTHLDLARALLLSLNPWIHQGPPNFMSIAQQRGHLAPNAPTTNTSNHPTPQVTCAPDHTTSCSSRADVTTYASTTSDYMQMTETVPTDSETTNSKL